MALCAAAVVLCAYLASFAPLQAKRAGFLGTAQTVSVRVRGRRPRLHYRLLTLCPAPTDPVPRDLLTLWARAGMCVCIYAFFHSPTLHPIRASLTPYRRTLEPSFPFLAPYRRISSTPTLHPRPTYAQP